MGLPFSRRRAPSCRKRVFRAEKVSASTASDTQGAHPARRKDAAAPCVRCLARRARGAAGVRVRRCLPCGQRRCRAARRIMACRGRERGFGTFCPSGNFTGAPENGETGRTPQGTEIHAISRTERALLPAKPSTSSYRRKRGALQGTPHARRGKPPRRAPKTSVPRLFTTHPRLFTTHSVPFTTFPHLCGRPMSLAAVPCLLLPLRVFMASAPFAAHPQRLYDFPTPAYGLSAPFATHSASFAAHPALLRPS